MRQARSTASDKGVQAADEWVARYRELEARLSGEGVFVRLRSAGRLWFVAGTSPHQPWSTLLPRRVESTLFLSMSQDVLTSMSTIVQAPEVNGPLLPDLRRRLEEVSGHGPSPVPVRTIALKVLPARTLSDESARRHFRKEALALAKLNHPNIATVPSISPKPLRWE